MLKHIPFYASLLGRPLPDGTKTATGHVLVYGAVEAHSMGARGCIASNKTLAQETGLSEKSISNILSLLNKAGWVRVKLDKNNHRIGIVPLMELLPAQMEAPSRTQEPPFPSTGTPLPVHGNIDNSIKEDSIEIPTTNVVGSREEQGGSQPFELVNHVVAIQGIKPFPSMPGQCAAAKRILQSGYSLDEAKQAADRMQADRYWKSRAWDLNNLARNITRYSRKEADRSEGFIYLSNDGERLTEEQYKNQYPSKGVH